MCFKPVIKRCSQLLGSVMVQVCFVLVICLLLTGINCQAQARYTISGTIKDAQTGESLIGATITTAELKQNGVVTNDYGFYSLSLPAGNYTLQISYVGYAGIEVKINLHKNITINQGLSTGNNLKEVVVKGGAKGNENVSSPQMGVNKLDASMLNDVPCCWVRRMF
jgi:hypothetical protein